MIKETFPIYPSPASSSVSYLNESPFMTHLKTLSCKVEISFNKEKELILFFASGTIILFCVTNWILFQSDKGF